MKIKKGDVINELSLPAIDGSVFDLQFVQGQKLMISLVISRRLGRPAENN